MRMVSSAPHAVTVDGELRHIRHENDDDSAIVTSHLFGKFYAVAVGQLDIQKQDIAMLKRRS